MLRRLPLAFFIFSLVGCSDDAEGTGGGGTGGQQAATTGSLSVTGSTTSGTGASQTVGSGSTSTGGAGEGSCLSPREITLAFDETGDTSNGALDVVALSCATEAALPEAVYRLTLAAGATVRVSGSDKSGQGVGVQVFDAACDGTSVGCEWASNGALDHAFTLPAGSWVFVVERNPAGPFELKIE